MRLRPFRHWGVAAFVSVVAWLAGYFFWGPYDSPEDYGSYFDAGTIKAILAAGVPLALLTGVLLSRRGLAEVLGFGLLTLTTVVVSWLVSFVFFGGFCIDEGEGQCITSWASRLGALGAALAVMVIGYLFERFGKRLGRGGRGGRSNQG